MVTYQYLRVWDLDVNHLHGLMIMGNLRLQCDLELQRTFTTVVRDALII